MQQQLQARCLSPRTITYARASCGKRRVPRSAGTWCTATPPPSSTRHERSSASRSLSQKPLATLLAAARDDPRGARCPHRRRDRPRPGRAAAPGQVRADRGPRRGARQRPPLPVRALRGAAQPTHADHPGTQDHQPQHDPRKEISTATAEWLSLARHHATSYITSGTRPLRRARSSRRRPRRPGVAGRRAVSRRAPRAARLPARAAPGHLPAPSARGVAERR